MNCHSLLVTALLVWSGTACIPHRQKVVLPPPPPPIEQPKPEDLRSHVEGTWSRMTRDERGGQMTFRPDGSLVFEGALESYNPARWELDPASHELILILPHVKDETMMVFLMYLKDGVKAVDRAGQRVIYTLTSDTESLNVAGWIYNRQTQTIIRSHAREAVE